MTDLIKKAKDALAEHVEMLIRKRSNMAPPDIDLLCKDLCALETLKRIENAAEYYDEDGYSYRRGRDANGRFTSRDSHDGSHDGGSSSRYYDGNSGTSGYSGHSRRDRTIAHIEELLDVAQSEQERQFLQQMLNRYQ